MIGLPPLLPPPRRRRWREPVVPMINVVFLLLVFFVMTADLTPPPPFEVTPPDGTSEPAAADGVLFVSADGALAFQGLQGPEALRAASLVSPLTLTVDRDLAGADLATIIDRLSALGAADIQLSVQSR